LSQAALARLVGMAKSTICECEGGRIQPSLTTLMRLSAALDVSTDDLLGLIEEPLRMREWRAFVRCCMGLKAGHLAWLMRMAGLLLEEQEKLHGRNTDA